MEEVKETKEIEEKREDEVEERIEQRKQKIKTWLSDKYNLTFLAILVFAIIIRIYYFSLTQNQPFWWDEAEYMGMAKAWAFGMEYEFLPVRPALFPLIAAIFFKISYSEFLPRFFILLLSVSAVVGTYYFGKEMYNKKIGLIASFLMSAFYLNLFYANRLLVEVPSLAFFIFSSLFFYKYIKTKTPKFLYIAAVMVAIGTLFKLSTAEFLFVAFLFLLVTEKLKFLKKKESWIALLIFILILSPYIIWGYLQFGGFVITQAGAWNAPDKGTQIPNFFKNIGQYLRMFPNVLTIPLFIVFALSLLSMYKLIIGFDLVVKNKDNRLKKLFFLILLIIIPLLTVSFSLSFTEDRYIITTFPSICILSGLFITRAYNFIKKREKTIAIIAVVLLLGLILFYQVRFSHNLTISKLDSYGQVKEAGLWLNKNSEPDDLIFTKSWPQHTYYGERKTHKFKSNESEFEVLLEELKPDFLVVSVFESHPQWLYAYPSEHPDRFEAVQAYFLDAQKQQPSLVIYKVKY